MDKSNTNHKDTEADGSNKNIPPNTRETLRDNNMWAM